MTDTQTKVSFADKQQEGNIYSIIDSDEPWEGRMLFTGKLILTIE